jgi:hypothetical protein
MYRTAFATLAALILLPGTTHGQLLQFDQDGGVRVNAPFVDVQVGPAGETYVRAPFTSVYAPGRRFIEPPMFGRRPFGLMFRTAAPFPAARGAHQPLPEMNWLELRQYVRHAATQLDASLARLADGDVWRDYLRPDAVLTLVSEDIATEPRPEEVDQFQQLSQTYDATAANPRLGRITDLSGFRGVQDGLRQLSVGDARDWANEGALQPADDELRNQLAASAMQLDQELRGSASSAGLRRFLELPPEVYAGTDADDAEPISGQHDLAELELMLRRYDRISRSPQLHDVSSLPSFRRTRRLLSDYVSSRQQRSGVEPELIPAEPLPAPLPR